jgi:hypothetical protein
VVARLGTGGKDFDVATLSQFKASF